MRAWVWRILIVIELVIFAGIIKSCAQTAMRFDLDYTRIPLNNDDIPIVDTLNVLFVFEKDCIGIVTIYDTLALEYIGTTGRFVMYIDVYHSDEQEYTIERHYRKKRFIWFVVPIKPFVSRKVYSLILESL